MPEQTVEQWLAGISSLTAADKTKIKDDLAVEGYATLDRLDAGAIGAVAEKHKASWKLAWKGALVDNLPKPAAAKTPLAVPALPAGYELNLATESAKTPEGITFRLPTALGGQASSAESRDPGSLSGEEWMAVAKKSGLLYGYRMDGAKPEVARYPVRLWKVPAASAVFFRSETHRSTTTSEVVYDEQSASYVKATFDKETASAAFPFASGSLERSRRERRASSSASKKLHMVGRWWFPKATVFLDRCTGVSRPSPNGPRPAAASEAAATPETEADREAGAQTFLARIDAALAFETSDPKKASALLNDVFADFGHAVPAEVVIGAELVFTHDQMATSEAESRQVQTNWGAALNVKVKKYDANASVGAAVGEGSADAHAVARMVEHMQFSPVGGVADQGSTPSAWLPTTRDPMNWAVVSTTKFMPTVDLLDADKRRRVVALYKVEHPLGHTTAPTLDNVLDPPQEGFLLGRLETTDDPSDGTLLGYTRASDSESEVLRGGASVHRRTQNDRYVTASSFLIPVVKGHTAVARHVANDARTDAQLRFVPIGFGQSWEQYLGAPEAVTDLTTPFSRTGSGFVVCTIDARPGGRGSVVLRNAATPAPSVTRLAATSVHYWETRHGKSIRARYQSFCVPVKGGLTLGFEATTTYADPAVTVHWIPLLNRSFGDASVRTIGTGYPAESDGFAVGWIEGDNESRGHLAIGVAPTLNELPGERMAATSVHYYREADVYLSHNTVTVPVRKGQAYRADYTQGWGTVHRGMYWVPLLP